MERLREYLNKTRGKKTAVSYSGGVDSSLIAYYAKEFADAVLIKSEFTQPHMIEEANEFTRRYKINFRIEEIQVLPETENNPQDRCYICKKKMLKKIKELGYDVIFDGTNLDDLKEKRPGIEANKELGVVSPLADLYLRKDDVRKIMAKIDGKIAIKPHESCLATRIPFGEKITTEKLSRIYAGENTIKSFGLQHIRLRDHFPLARIQAPKADHNKIIETRDIIQRIKELGYEYVTLDLEELK